MNMYQGRIIRLDPPIGVNSLPTDAGKISKQFEIIYQRQTDRSDQTDQGDSMPESDETE